MVSAAEQLAANLKFSTFAKASELKQRLLFTLGALLIYRLGTFIPIPGIDTSKLADQTRQERQPARHAQRVLGRRTLPLRDLPAQHHAVHHGIDHYPAPNLGPAGARSAAQRRRVGAQAAQPIHALSDGADRHRAGVADGSGAERPRDQSGLVLPAHHHRLAGRRHHVPRLARRAGDLARHRQRLFPHHLLRYRSGNADRALPHPGARQAFSYVSRSGAIPAAICAESATCPAIPTTHRRWGHPVGI